MKHHPATLLAQGPSPGLQLQMDFLSPLNFQPVGLSCTLLLLQQLGRGVNASVWRVLLQKYLGDGSSAAAQLINRVEEGSVLAVKLSSGLGYACTAALATEQLVMEATAESQYAEQLWLAFLLAAQEACLVCLWSCQSLAAWVR